MATVSIKADLDAVAAAAAAHAVEAIATVLQDTSTARWVVAGGTAPLGAYDQLATHNKSDLDWSKVLVTLGDERSVTSGSPDATWPGIKKRLIAPLGIPEANLMVPKFDVSAEAMATDYAEQLLPWTQADGTVSIDYLWLGVGEDGHTLSLFPGHDELEISDVTVTAVHNSPKPPSDRISLTFQALKGVKSALILATGEGKAAVLAAATAGDQTMPIARAVTTIEQAGGTVTWLLDAAAASKLPN